MRTHELWMESYQGEVLGETLFGLLAQRETDASRRMQLGVLTLLERSTRALAEPLFERGGFERGDTAATVEAATNLADTVATMSWEEFLGSFEPVTKQFSAKYLELVELSTDETERRIAQTYVAHEEALASFARRALGQEEGEPLERILALPHIAAAAGA
jgi:hypothetical protein